MLHFDLPRQAQDICIAQHCSAMGAQDISCLWDRGQADQVGSHAAKQEGRCAGAQLQTAVNFLATKSTTLANELYMNENFDPIEGSYAME